MSYQRDVLEWIGLDDDSAAAVLAVHDQIESWRRDNPGRDPLLSGECDDLFIEMGRIGAAALGFPDD